MLLVERTVATPAAKGVGLCVPLTEIRKIRQSSLLEIKHENDHAPEGCGTYVPLDNPIISSKVQNHSFIIRTNEPFV